MYKMQDSAVDNDIFKVEVKWKKLTLPHTVAAENVIEKLFLKKAMICFCF